MEDIWKLYLLQCSCTNSLVERTFPFDFCQLLDIKAQITWLLEIFALYSNGIFSWKFILNQFLLVRVERCEWQTKRNEYYLFEQLRTWIGWMLTEVLWAHNIKRTGCIYINVCMGVNKNMKNTVMKNFTLLPTTRMFYFYPQSLFLWYVNLSFTDLVKWNINGEL